MQNIQKKVFKDKLKYDNQVILKYTIEYPQINENKCITGALNFNSFNYEKACKLQEFARTKLFNDAKEVYEYNKQNGYPIMVFEIYMTYEITYNSNNIVSLYVDEYIFSGGAHGNTIRTSQNWDFRIGKQIPLKCFFKNNPNYVQNILTQINNKITEDIQNGNDVYFGDYCCLTVNAFKVENYYLQNGYIVIYFQQYDIAPYSSGILTFNIEC